MSTLDELLEPRVYRHLTIYEFEVALEEFLNQMDRPYDRTLLRKISSVQRNIKNKEYARERRKLTKDKQMQMEKQIKDLIDDNTELRRKNLETTELLHAFIEENMQLRRELSDMHHSLDSVVKLCM